MSTKKVSVPTSNKLFIQEDPDTGELFVELPDRLLKELGWEEGDDLEWVEQPNGNWTIKKVDNEEDTDD